MSRDATKSSNGFFYQRIYFLSVILDKLISNDDEIKEVKCIEENNIDGNEYEDFTFVCNKKITTYQMKYKNINSKKTKESIVKDKDCGFIKSFVPYFDKKYDNCDIENIYYIVSKKENGESNFLDIFTYDSETIYKYMVLLSMEKTVCGDYKESTIINKYEEIKNNIDIQYDDSQDKNKNINFENFKKIMKTIDKSVITAHVKKYKVLDGYTYTDLIKNINDKIKNILSDNIKNDIINDSSIMINYIRNNIFDILIKNSFGKNEMLKLEIIKKEITQFHEGNKSKKNSDLFNDLFSNFINDLDSNDEKDDIIIEIMNLFNNIENDLSCLNDIKIDEDVLNVISKIYKKNYENKNEKLNENLKKIYNKTKHIFCVQLCYKLHTREKSKCNYDEYLKFTTSISTYYNHDIKVKIIAKKSKSDVIKKFTETEQKN
jgi:hypothetical protein